jgi:ABC-type Fe3+/spermidine/putrescine transport system ATPase subunit
MTEIAIEIKNLCKRFGETVTADDISLILKQGEHAAVLGASGSGKTTLLRLIAGLEMPDSGEILLSGENACAIPPHRRGISMTFQNAALWSHMTVRQNILFGLRIREKKSRDALLLQLAEMLEIEELLHRAPFQLSGGEAKRVALARALAAAAERDILLLDEPFANLDGGLKERVISKLRDELSKKTLVLVTHDPAEAEMLCGRDCSYYSMAAGRLIAGKDACGVITHEGEERV